MADENSTDAGLRAKAYGLERRAMSDIWMADDPPSEAEIETSKAISAKRQADALERIANAFDGQSVSGNVLYWLENVASSLHGRG